MSLVLCVFAVLKCYCFVCATPADLPAAGKISRAISARRILKNDFDTLLQEKLDFLENLIILAKSQDTLCIKILFCHNPKAGGTTIRRFFQSMSREGLGRSFEFIGPWTKPVVNKRSWRHFISSERKNPLSRPLLAIEAHTTGSILHDVIPSWNEVKEVYSRNSCLTFTFAHLRNPETHILSVYNQHLGVEKGSNQFIAPYWHNIISCGLRNPTLNFFLNPLYHKKNIDGKYKLFPTEFESKEGEKVTELLHRNFDFVADLKDYTALFALLHTLYNTTACVVHTGKTSRHTDYMGGHTRIIPLNARLPNMLCKVRKRADDATRYNLKLQKLAAKGSIQKIEPELIQEVYSIDEEIYESTMQLHEKVNMHLKLRLAEFMHDCEVELSTLNVAHL